MLRIQFIQVTEKARKQEKTVNFNNFSIAKRTPTKYKATNKKVYMVDSGANVGR